MDLTEVARDIAQRLAAAGRREPLEVLYSAAQLVLGAHLGDHAHHAKMHELGRRSPHLCELFEQVQSVIAAVARHWRCAEPRTGRAAHGGHGHGGGGHPHPHHHQHHPHAATDDVAVSEAPWWGWVPPPLEYVVLEDERQDDEQRELEEPPPVGHATGRCAAHPVVVVPERATGEPLGAPLNAAWAGIEGHGRDYLTEEQRRMDAERPFGDGEPDWPVHWFERG
jgi:hypothetical protein